MLYYITKIPSLIQNRPIEITSILAVTYPVPIYLYLPKYLSRILLQVLTIYTYNKIRHVSTTQQLQHDQYQLNRTNAIIKTKLSPILGKRCKFLRNIDGHPAGRIGDVQGSLREPIGSGCVECGRQQQRTCDGRQIPTRSTTINDPHNRSTSRWYFVLHLVSYSACLVKAQSIHPSPYLSIYLSICLTLYLALYLSPFTCAPAI